MRESFEVSAPGKLMLLGEHAVLHGHRALVCAINRRVTARLAPRTDTTLVVRSELGELKTDLRTLRAAEPFRFVLGAVRESRELLDTGFELQIRSQFSSETGFGSSAAVTVVTVAAVQLWCQGELDVEEVFARSLRAVRSVQGTASGADVAASTFGGAIVYRANPLEIQRLRGSFPLVAVYSGAKRPTSEVIAFVAERRERHPAAFEHIYAAMDACVGEAKTAIESGDLPALGELLNIGQGLMDAIGVSNRDLSALAYRLREDAGIFGAKISGSGLGDCVVGIGRLEKLRLPRPTYLLEVMEEGVRVD